jgi:hypothetical protein
MNIRRALIVAMLGLAATTSQAADGIWRCDGTRSVTYQQAPCDTSGAPPAISTDYPPVNLAERERLLAREAALDARLEARRSREAQESIARAQREVKVLREAMPTEPAFVIVRAPARPSRQPRHLTVR